MSPVMRGSQAGRLGRPARRTAREAIAARLRILGAAVAAVGLAALVGVGLPGSAQAGSPGYNQITGAGQTASAVTVKWTQGLLDSSNKALAGTAGELSPNSDRGSASPASPLSFMYPDFKNLQVTVSQTQDIRAQGVTVSWTGGKQTTVTDNTAAFDFLQMMECYGDASTGPTPEGCEYGTPGLLNGGNIDNPYVGQRVGDICVPGSVPVPGFPTDKTPVSLNGDNSVAGCDTYEPVTTDVAAHLPSPCTVTTEETCAGGIYSIPFVPAGSTKPAQDAVYQPDLSNYFGQSDSNEIQQAITGSDGTGQVQFETVTSTQSQGLGCGETESNGQVRSCWLVIVPRGEYEPNGYQLNVNSTASNGVLNTTPLAVSNWAQRIQVHLSYAPDGQFCPLGTPVTLTEGTELASRAMLSWALALAQQDKCSALYSFGTNGESEVTTDLSSPGTSGVGLGLTTIPIGSETTEDQKPPGKVPKMLYAPVAVTGLGFGFNINDSAAGFITSSMKLSPMLLAKALTQVYLRDLPDYYLADQILPTDNGKSTVLQKNPVDIAVDPEWVKLNPGITPLTWSSSPLAPLLITGKSALIQQVWQWVDANSATAAWLDGSATDKQYGIVADPDYVSSKPQLGKFPSPTFPRDYAGVLDHTTDPKIPSTATAKGSGLLLPEVDSFDLSASDVLLASNPGVAGWDPNIQNPQGGNGYWDSLPLQAVGQRFIWGLSDTPSMAAYGLIPASMCSSDGTDGTGTNCVSLSAASITAALATAKADSSGLLHVNPATVKSGAYPLVDVVYAAVPVAQSAAQLMRYAELISYAAGAGQTVGSAPGDLPAGYLPLPANLATQAKAVAAQLRQLASKQGSPSSTPTTTSPAQSTTSGQTTQPSGTGNGTGSGTGTSTPNPSSGPSANSPASAAASPTEQGPTVIAPTAQLVAGTTPKDPVGSVRWAIISVVIAGLVSAGAGILLRSARLPRMPRRSGGAGP